MSVYLDTSVVVAASTSEQRTPAVQSWLQRLTGKAVISDWVIAEAPSGLSMKMRAGVLTLDQRDAVLAEFERLCAEASRVLPVRREDFHAAGRLASRAGPNLRAGDALYPALAATEHLSVATLDRRMATAAIKLGVIVAPIDGTP